MEKKLEPDDETIAIVEMPPAQVGLEAAAI